MEPIAAFLGIASLATIALATASDEPDGRRLAWGLGGLWATANALWYWNALNILPLCDLVLGCVAVSALARHYRGWLVGFAITVEYRLFAHVAVAMDFGNYLMYAHFLNATFALLLGMAAFPGGRNVAFNRLLDWVHGVRGGGSAGKTA